MKRTGLILLACLLLVLPSVAQAPEKATSDDLVVTAEIVGYGYSVYRARKSKPVFTLSARMMIRNTTNHEREIVVMRCSWDWAWTSKGIYSICGPPGCDGNFPDPIIIPAGQTVEFYDELCASNLTTAVSDSIKLFQLGFIDVADKDYKAFLHNEKLSHEPVIYWSNVLRDDARPIATEETKEKVRRRQYGLVGDDK